MLGWQRRFLLLRGSSNLDDHFSAREMNWSLEVFLRQKEPALVARLRSLPLVFSGLAGFKEIVCHFSSREMIWSLGHLVCQKKNTVTARRRSQLSFFTLEESNEIFFSPREMISSLRDFQCQKKRPQWTHVCGHSVVFFEFLNFKKIKSFRELKNNDVSEIWWVKKTEPAVTASLRWQ